MRTVNIGPFSIGRGHPAHIIAEVGGNFTTFEEAQNLIDLAIGAGADSVKLQTYRAETISSKVAMYDMPNTGHASQFDLFKKYEIDFALHEEIWGYCESKDILIFSTPSHISDIELLEKLDCPVYKVGSDDAVNIPFLKEVAAVGKPIILSTGMCTMREVADSVAAILGTGNPDLILLHCVTNYPCSEASTNLNCIRVMQEEFGLPVGWSDHTLTNVCSLAAATLGAAIVERHFTHDRGAEGPDHMLSVEPDEFASLVKDIRLIEAALGDGVKRPSADENKTRVNNRKSLIAASDIKAGEVIGRARVSIKRPGYGIPPNCLDEVAGRVARNDLAQDTPITWDDV